MAIFKLTPVEEHKDHAAWEDSLYCGSCLVAAGDEATARLYAAQAFSTAMPLQGTLPRAEAWTCPQLVACTEIRATLRAMPEGMIVTPGGLQRFERLPRGMARHRLH